MPPLIATTTLTQPPTLRSTATLELIAMVALVAFLVAREIVGTSSDERTIKWGRGVMIAILPLLMVFAAIVADKIAHAL